MQMIKESVYEKRRVKLIKKFSHDSIGVIFGSKPKIRSNDTEYPFRQDSNFYYLSGIEEQGAVMVFVKDKNGVKTVLFVEQKDETKELWSGKVMGVEGAKKLYKFDEIYSNGEFESKMKEFLKDKKRVHVDLTDERVFKFFEKNRNIESVHSITKPIEKMRLIKSKDEIKIIKKAIKITKKAHHKAILLEKRGMFEYELASKIEYIFKKNGASGEAYGTIVASGNNANTLHYVKNSKKMSDHELVLIDAGCEYEYYASDITRTIPVGGKFTKAQKEIYELVLQTQLKIIEMIKPDMLRSTLQKESEISLIKGLVKLGMLDGSVDEILKNAKYKKYYPHGIGHWMGLDVHDMSPYKNKKNEEIALQKGMVLTIEPALYIDKKDKTVPKKYRGIGIRIEDDILVTKDGYKNLSKKIIKNIEDIENFKDKRDGK